MSYQPLSSPLLLPFSSRETGMVLDDPENIGKALLKLLWIIFDWKKSAENYFWVRRRFDFRLFKIQRKTFFCLNECKTGNMTFGRRDIFSSELLKVSMAFLDLKTFQMKVDCLMSSTPASLMNQLLKTYHSCLKDSEWNKTAGHKFELRIFLCKVCCLFLLKSDPAATPSNFWNCFCCCCLNSRDAIQCWPSECHLSIRKNHLEFLVDKRRSVASLSKNSRRRISQIWNESGW